MTADRPAFSKRTTNASRTIKFDKAGSDVRFTGRGLTTLILLIATGPACAGGGGDSPCLARRAGMVAWWPGDGTTDDLLGGAPGILKGSARFGSGQVKQAFVLDGVDSWVDLGNASKVQVSSADFSVEGWVFFNSHQGDMSVIDKMSATAVNVDGWRLIKQADDRFWFCLGGGTQNRCTPSDTAFTVYSTTVVAQGAWFHLAAVKSSISFALYVNGVREDVRTPVPAFLDTSSTSLRAGSNAAEGSYLDGLLDEVKLFDRALTEQEVQDIYRAGSQGECR